MAASNDKPSARSGGRPPGGSEAASPDANHAARRRKRVELVRGLHDQMEGAVDPFGLAAPIVHAQMAWMAHPREIADHLWGLSADLWRLQLHTVSRLCGLPSEDPIRPHADDLRFVDPVWRERPSWDLVKEWYLAFTRHTQDMLYDTPGLSSRDRRRAAFWWRKWLNAVAPTNFLWTNPVAMRLAIESNGDTLVRGFGNFLADLRAGEVRMTDPSDFRVGDNLATTPGAVVLRNRLVEVIHYAPTRTQVHREPVVIIAPWINKFYVLDLTPANSMVRFLLDQGFDVFITSWKNPDESLRDAGFDDYLREGVGAAIEVARRFCGVDQVHAAGYCLGGTALATYMAWASAHYPAGSLPVADWTLFATLVDFHKPGDIEIFIDPDSIRHLTGQMARRGYLDGKAMASSFRLLRSNSLIWHYVVNGWLYGNAPPPFDLMYWNMDTTRMPARMHSWYLNELYLANRLIEPGALSLLGEHIDLRAIRQPLYAVSAEDDHIAPWRQTFKTARYVGSTVRHVLSSSGHILGIVNPVRNPPRRRYWVDAVEATDTAELWRQRAELHQGTWWEDWMRWLKPRAGALVPARPAASADFPALAAAPGQYVLER